ncbi:hypothetical protein [Vibrio furnissii]|uniref:hypothetical protein n=1 Tax=Vibrio furnissii TaxID=29494 RepID=UPI001C9C25C9|nr:hypothetical protein [Vibrio furnissii]MBY7933089.1 hypothetical protein [Vibrio fluvialis]MCG6230253.1 hypothetical protein [Vibrio furnissii]MCG6268452.1 hypothetical protein [Vibrio furnissii]
MTDNVLCLLEHHNQLTDHILKSDLPRPVKLLMSVISTFYNLNKQSATPTRRTIAANLGLSMSHVSALIAQAVKLGVLVSTPQFEPVVGSEKDLHRQTANRYGFNLQYFGLYYDKVKVATKKRLRSLGYAPKQTKQGQFKPADTSRNQEQIISQANHNEALRQTQIAESVAAATGVGFDMFTSMKSSLFGRKPDK